MFFVLGHLVAGLRVVLLAHGTHAQATTRLWYAGILASAAVATAIIAGMCGVRL
ncbi:MAG: hypothetical protein GAK31_01831 [Stenotrophomonas maltophilia]|uniref:Uncharacterized protein n=1 Tax=Stenotrophomonas maltophilia TaxID=40324 RepID=A0A7V8FIH7_STEMA|nr:MAG: hypothetical protein GAK31_01831 [Stenotrophomonas maltophilia]